MNTINHNLIMSLYEKHKNDVFLIKRNMKALISTYDNYKHFNRIWSPQYDDIEAEITSLLILEHQPRHIVEFSPCEGWSSKIIQETLQRLPYSSQINSYDIVSRVKDKVTSTDKVTYKFHLGDVRKKYSTWDLSSIDYLFIDSDHSKAFTEDG